MLYSEIVAAGGHTTALHVQREAIRSLQDQLEFHYSGLTLHLYRAAGHLILSQIVLAAEKRNHGIGSAVMTAVTEFADQQALPMTLTPHDVFGGTVPRLTQFYQRFGFRPSERRAHTMDRNPQSSSAFGGAAVTTDGHFIIAATY